MKNPSAKRLLPRWRKLLAAAAATSVFVAGMPFSAADMISDWLSAINGNWTDQTKWDNSEPNNGNGGFNYDASITATGAAYTITLNSGITVNGLTLNSANATVDQTSGTLTIANGGVAALTVGTYNLDGGTISGSSITAAGSVLQVSSNSSNTLIGDAIAGDIFASASSSVVQIGGDTTFVTAHLIGSGSSLGFQNNQTLGGGATTSTISFENGSASHIVESIGTGSAFTVGANGVIQTAAGFTGTATIGPSSRYSGTMNLTNQGLISDQSTNATVTIDPANFTNAAGGIVQATATGAILNINAATSWSNAGMIKIQGGATTNFLGSWTNAGGTVSVDATSTLNLGGSFTTASLGTLNLTSGSAVNVAGNWTNTGQTFNFTSATGFWTLNGGAITGGTLTFPVGQSLPVAFNGNNLLGGVTIAGDISLNGSIAETQIGGGTTFGTAHMIGSGSSLGFQNNQTLGGGAAVSTISFESGSNSHSVESIGTGSAFTVGANGVIQTAAGFSGIASIGPVSRYSGSMNLTNQGLISDQSANATVTINPASFTNAAGGIVQATAPGAILNINASTVWSNAGTIKVQGGSTANFLGSWTNAGGTVSVDATSTLNLGGSFTTASLGTLNLTGGSAVNVAGNWTNTGQTFNFTSATGFWALNGGTITGGTLTFPVGQGLPVAFNSNNLLSGVSIAGDLSLNASVAETQIGGGTTFGTAHLIGGSSSLGFQNNQILGGGATLSTISFENGSSSHSVESIGTGSAFTVGANGVIQTAAGFSGTASIGPVSRYSGSMNLTNQGLISDQSTNATVTISPASFTNAAGGLVQATAAGAILNINASTVWSNAGTIKVQGGSTANFLGSWTNSAGTVNVDATSTLNLGGNFATANLGMLNLTSGSAVNVTGNWTNTGQTFNFTSTTGFWTLNGGAITGGTLTFPAGQSLPVAFDINNLLSGVAIAGDLSLNASVAETQIGGGTTFGTAHLVGASSSLGFQNNQTLGGGATLSTISFENGSTSHSVESIGTGSAFTVGANGVIQTAAGFTGGASIGPVSRYSGSMNLTNQGLISDQSANATVTINPASFTNAAGGIVQATAPGAILNINASTVWSNAGTIKVQGGSTANFLGSWTNAGGTVSVDATSTLNLGGSFTTASLGTLNLTSGSAVNVAGNWTNTGQTFNFTSATGFWALNGGTITGGTLTLPAGQGLPVTFNSNNLLSGVTIAGDLSLNADVAETQIGGGATFGTAHLIGPSSSLGFQNNQTLGGGATLSTISFENGSTSHSIESIGTGSAFTVGENGVIQTAAGFSGTASIGPVSRYSGSMNLTNQGLISSRSNGAAIVINPATFADSGTLEAINGGTLQVTAGYTQNGGVTRVNGGTISVSTTPSLKTITIASGRIEGNGTIKANVTVDDTISPSFDAAPSSGTLAITGDLILAPTATVQLEIGGNTQGTQYDLLSETGAAALMLQGTLSVSLIDGFVPAPTDTFTVISSNQALNGMFANVGGGRVIDADGLSSFVVQLSGDNLVLSNFLVPEPSSPVLLGAGLGFLACRRFRRWAV